MHVFYSSFHYDDYTYDYYISKTWNWHTEISVLFCSEPVHKKLIKLVNLTAFSED